MNDDIESALAKLGERLNDLENWASAVSRQSMVLPRFEAAAQPDEYGILQPVDVTAKALELANGKLKRVRVALDIALREQKRLNAEVEAKDDEIKKLKSALEVETYNTRIRSEVIADLKKQIDGHTDVEDLKEAARELNEQLTESREENRRLRVTSVGVETNVKLADELNLAKQRLKDFEKFRFYGWCNPAVPGSFVPKGAEETLTDGFIDRQGYTKRLYQEP